MKVTFYGGAGGVTGSKHLVEFGNDKILLDCGTFQGRRKQTREYNSQLPFDAKSITAVIISHGHLDHCGTLPLLIRNGYEGSIYATAATRDVAAWILKDAAHIQEMDAEYMNKHKIKGHELAQPLFTQHDVDEVIARFIEVPYVRTSKEWFQITPKIRLKVYDAGHILGSAVPVLEFISNDKVERIAFTGDLGRTGTPLLPDPEYIKDDVATLISESTYGNRVHHPVEEAVERLKKLVIDVYDRGGKIIVPTFALGRTQELVYVLHQLTDKKLIPRLPIYVDSPLATHLTDVFTRHPETYDEEAWKDFGKRGDLPLAFRNLIYTESRDQSKALNNLAGPFMVISASGMCEAGRILHHLINNIQDQRNLILITGFQAQHTLGRRLVDGEKVVRIFGHRFAVKAQVEVLNEFSAHADAPALMDYAEHINSLQRIFLVHGENSQAQALRETILNKHTDWQIDIPEIGNSYELN